MQLRGHPIFAIRKNTGMVQKSCKIIFDQNLIDFDVSEVNIL